MPQLLKPFALSLSFALILMLGAMPLNVSSHTIDHQHHSAQTHTTGICAWMCAAAQTIFTDSQVFSPEVSPLEPLQHLQIFSISILRQIFLPSRAPPI